MFAPTGVPYHSDFGMPAAANATSSSSKTGDVMLSPNASTTFDLPGTPIGSTDAILEVSRAPLQLVWNIEDNAFTRYDAPAITTLSASAKTPPANASPTSFARTSPARRATPPLRDTPPVTDLSELSATDLDTSESDRELSDAEALSPIPPPLAAPPTSLSAIEEAASDASAPASPASGADMSLSPSASSPSDSPMTDHPSESSAAIEIADPRDKYTARALTVTDANAELPALSLADVDRTPLADRRRQGADVLRSRLLERQRRSASSPSRSPARRTPPRARQRVERAVRAQAGGRRSFYDYLFA